MIGDDVGGIAVHIGACVAAIAGAGEVLVSSTVKGSGGGFWLEPWQSFAQGCSRRMAHIRSRTVNAPLQPIRIVKSLSVPAQTSHVGYQRRFCFC